MTDINRTISHLENSATQHNIDEMYENFVAIIKTEMNEKLPSKLIHLSDGIYNKARKCKKKK